MNIKSFKLVGLVSLSLISLTGAIAQTPEKDPGVRKEVLTRVSELLEKSAFVPGIDFTKWDSFVTPLQPTLLDSANDDAFARVLNENLFKFAANRHTFLSTPRSNETRRTGKLVGIGIATQITEEGLVIIRTIAGAPAAQAGLIPGDTIQEVDGHKVEGTRGIPGEPGTKVHIKIKHADGSTKVYTLTRKQFSTVRKEELLPVDNDTMRLTVSTFDFTYDAGNVENLMKKAAKSKSLIIDLRDNPGGAVSNLQHLLGLLVPDEKPVGTFLTRGIVDKFVKETGGQPTDLMAIAKWSPTKVKAFKNTRVPAYQGHVAVLVNGFSGSAAEICAAGLRDTIGATVVGTKSAGAVLVSLISDASNGYSLEFPIGDYVTVAGLRLEGHGVVPELSQPDPTLRLPTIEDPVVTKAAALLARARLRDERSASN